MYKRKTSPYKVQASLLYQQLRTYLTHEEAVEFCEAQKNANKDITDLSIDDASKKVGTTELWRKIIEGRERSNFISMPLYQDMMRLYGYISEMMIIDWKNNTKTSLPDFVYGVPLEEGIDFHVLWELLDDTREVLREEGLTYEKSIEKTKKFLERKVSQKGVEPRDRSRKGNVDNLASIIRPTQGTMNKNPNLAITTDKLSLMPPTAESPRLLSPRTMLRLIEESKTSATQPIEEDQITPIELPPLNTIAEKSSSSEETPPSVGEEEAKDKQDLK